MSSTAPVHRLSRRRIPGVVLLVVAVAAVGLAPLVTGSPAAAQITGATSLADTVRIGPATIDGATTDIHILAYNDLHGHLDGRTPGTLYGKYAGGAAALAKMVRDKKTVYKNQTVTVFAGDSIGATPLSSSLFLDEPTILANNFIDADFASVGNHEFDRGMAHLLRMQNGGCPTGGCTGAPYPELNNGKSPVFTGATFKYLAANVTKTDGSPFLPAYGIKKFTSNGGTTIKVGVIGEVLEGTPGIVTPAGVAGLKFGKEAPAANAAVKELRDRGVKTNILVIHEGGFQTGSPTKPGDCVGLLSGSPIESIIKDLDKSIRIIVSGHTHNEYRCIVSINGVDRLVTSASSFGRALSDITLSIDDITGELISASAVNSVVENSSNANTSTPRVADPTKVATDVQALADFYNTLAAPKANKVIGRIAGDMLKETQTPLGELPAGDLIADSQLAATKTTGNAVIAFTNPGGIRSPGFVFAQSSAGEAPGELTYSEAFTVQPFGNSLVTLTLTGAQIRQVLEQQFTGCRAQTTTRVLQVSAGFSYQQDPAASACAGKIGAITLDAKPIDDAAKYRVTVNSFLATGGDGFTVFNDGTNRLGGDIDLDALTAYFAAAPGVVPVGKADRIVGYTAK